MINDEDISIILVKESKSLFFIEVYGFFPYFIVR